MQRTITVHIAAASIVLIGALGAGCGSDEPLAGSQTRTPAQNATVPSFADIDAALLLEGNDEAVVKAALAAWNHDAGTSDASRPFMGRRQHEMEFVAAVAPSLDDTQLTKLVSLIVARREDRREEMREHRGDGARMEMLSRQLNLTANQQTALVKLHEETRAQAHTQFEAFKNGAITKDELHSRMEAIHDASREKMAGILTAGQLAKFDALREARMERRGERRMGNADERVEHHIGWLDAALGLTDQQASQAETAMTTMTQARASIHAAREAGTVTREQAREQMRAAHTTFEEALVTILTAEQEARLAILEPLLPGRRHHA